MKRIVCIALVAAAALSAVALDYESVRFTDKLLTLTVPRAPEVFEDAVIFTASAARRAVGVVFENENYGQVHWMKKLVTRNATKSGDGVLFLAYQFPRGLRELRYRLVVDGLWTTDPWNPARSVDASTGIGFSTVALPVRSNPPAVADDAPGVLHLRYETAPGETVTVAGNFNEWDPFMFELPEVAPGHYALDLPLPPGTYEYVFYHRGERVLDPENPRKVYTLEGKTASQIALR